jgi:hypothetical protein
MGGALTTEQIAEGREKLVESLKAKATDILTRQVGKKDLGYLTLTTDYLLDLSWIWQPARSLQILRVHNHPPYITLPLLHHFIARQSHGKAHLSLTHASGPCRLLGCLLFSI